VETCIRLKSLTICSEHFLDNHFKHIAKLTNLERLKISECSKITDDGFECIKGLNKLTKLELSDCTVARRGLRSIQKLPNLVNLAFFRCDLPGNRLIKGISKNSLQDLILAETKFTNEAVNNLGRLFNPTNIILRGKSFTDNNLESIGNINSLTGIAICKSSMSEVGLNHVLKLINLKNLYILECPNITSNYIAKIQKLYDFEIQFLTFAFWF
jgi:hypothetical protein